MYLNVNLTVPQTGSGSEGSCTTPKTPEILNSLINLTSPPLPQSYEHYQSQIESGELPSPVSDVSSPAEDFKPLVISPSDEHRSTFELQSPSRERYNSGGSVYGRGGFPGGGGGLAGGGFPGTSYGYGPLAGASPPSTPDLPSPVSSMEATKSALIKEGLKLQIRTKLQTAGIPPLLMYDDMRDIKEEMTDEDEERRRRRRERNKVAATKCRNKKKEKTVILVSESETVEEVNVRLKNEIQRLTSEKNHLEGLLHDPNHQTSCRHTPRCSSKARPPLLIITPADGDESIPSPNSDPLASPTSSTTSSSSSSNSCSSSPSSITSSSPSRLPSPCSSSPSNFPSASQSLPTQSTATSSCPTSSPPQSSSSSQYLAPKYSPSHLTNQRHHPYQYRSPSSQSPALQTSMCVNTLTPPSETKSYCTSLPSSTPQAKPGYIYSNMEMSAQTHEFTPPNPPAAKSVYTSGRSRSLGQPRYTPYGGRQQQQHGLSPLVTHGHPQNTSLISGSGNDGCESYGRGGAGGNGCGRTENQGFRPEMLTTPFFPPCSYSSM